MLAHNTLAVLMQSLWQMMFHQNVSIEEQMRWIPYERDIYVDMTIQELERQAEEKKKQQG